MLDNNGDAHVFYGIMRLFDDDLSDESSFYNPSANGIAYWTESSGEDLTPPTVQDTINWSDGTSNGRWYSDMSFDHIIAEAPDLDDDCVVGGVDSTSGAATYFSSRSSMPSAGIDANGDLYLSFSAYTETISNGTQVFRHIYIIKSTDNGITWSNPIDVTPHPSYDGMKECVFGSMSPKVDSIIRIVYQSDDEPGLAVRGDEDPISNNDIIYLEIPADQDWDYEVYGCMDATATNYNSTATADDGCCSFPPPPPSGISDNLNLITSVNIYPNPANETTAIQITSKLNEEITLSIVDMLGKVIYTHERTVTKGLNIEHINVSKFNTGVYFINTTIGENIISKKLVITEQ